MLLKAQSEFDEEDPYVKALSDLKISSALIPTLQFQFKNMDILQKCLSEPENYAGIIKFF